ncbi:hypothetical protein Taro_011413 [Colocasia esculenta]|uniref:SBP-type domain-containing protein n=1 Tax=Colocasia esculenta TaxID=4460 RepID=A0A843U5T9_COLES|nr:hypothetical protein [Colocasia esculenta]
MNPFVMPSPHPVEEPIPEQPPTPCHQIFPLYDRCSGAFEVPGTLFSITPPPVSASPTAVEEDYSVRLYGLSQMPPPAPAEPEAPSGPAMRIGLNLGGRTYFASSPDGELMRLGTNVYRRSGGSAGAGAGGVSASMVVAPPPACKARCQAEGCGADLTRAKHYHRRHKVCEFHSKAAAVIAHGLTQRFCQQCSRFHVLSEFDQGKRSCRKRLADHNRRRRKTQPSPSLAPAMSPPPQREGSPNDAAITNPPNAAAAKPTSVDGCSSAGGIQPAAAAALVVPPASPTRMVLGRCFHPARANFNGSSSSSTSSPSSCSSSRSSSGSVLPHVADFGSYYRPIDMSIWDASVVD